MRCMWRNKVPFWYAPYAGKTAVQDEYGNETGEYRATYGTPVKLMGSVSPATGKAQLEQFGTLEKYDKVIVYEDPNCAMDESSVLWVDKPLDDSPDYVVKRVARSLTCVSYAISKVTVHGG